MSTFPNPYIQSQPLEYGRESVVSRFMSNVFAWMCAGLATTAVVAWLVAANIQTLAPMLGGGALIILIIAQLALVFTISSAINKIGPGAAIGLFLLYAALNGVLFSFIFLVYTGASIAVTFLVAAGMFGGMALIGYVTRMDLSHFRGLLFMGLISLVIATIVNMFWANSTLYWAITYVGVFLFLGLTAYDTQRLKELAYATQGNPRMANRLAVNGALMLYLDFINIFLYMLRIMGQRRND